MMSAWNENRFAAITLYLWVALISGLFVFHSWHLIDAVFGLLGFP